MSEIEYAEALKLGKKEYKSRVAQGKFPYLPVLDEILSHVEIQTEQSLGQVQIPLDFVVGTSTVGRAVSFAANFMPILDQGTEFAAKWTNLSEAQVKEGIRDPIVAYEYLNRYYVVEGNKRVSVLKYYKADSISAVVTRKVPVFSEENEEIKVYFEFVKFSEITGLNSIEFTRSGKAEQLLKLMGKTEVWDEDTRLDFKRVLFHFSKAYKLHGGDKLPITVGDAITAFMTVYGYENMLDMTEDDYDTYIEKSWNEFEMLTEKQSIGLVMDPKKKEVKTPRSFLNYFIPVSAKKYTVAFLYPKAPELSDWIYAHELGRIYLEETFHDQMKTICVSDVGEENTEEVLNEVIRQGANIIFCVAPQMMQPSLKVAIEHPEVKILNCSLNTPHKYIRTYYARMYEAKFISGMIAGSMTDNDKIAYIADYPIYGMIANINAFGLGAACVNPRAKIYLEWSTQKGYDLNRFLQEHDIHYVSDQDMITPRHASRQFGFYRYQDGTAQNLVMPVWNWGIFYEEMIQSILKGSYQNEDSEKAKALNYWWGMSAGVIDLICSPNVPARVRFLAEHIKKDICSGDIVPFYGEIYAQDKTLKNEEAQEMKPEDIMKMDYLVENIIGTIPPIGDFVDAAQSIVYLKGVEEKK